MSDSKSITDRILAGVQIVEAATPILSFLGKLIARAFDAQGESPDQILDRLKRAGEALGVASEQAHETHDAELQKTREYVDAE